MSPRITFGPSAAEDVANELGATEGENGYLVDEDGAPIIPEESEEPLTMDDFSGSGVGSRVFIGDDFNSIAAYVEKYRGDSE
jgi:hypothetical protein